MILIKVGLIAGDGLIGPGVTVVISVEFRSTTLVFRSAFEITVTRTLCPLLSCEIAILALPPLPDFAISKVAI